MENLILFLTLWAATASALFITTLILLMVSRNNNKTLSNKIIEQNRIIEHHARQALNSNNDKFQRHIRLVSSDYDENYLRKPLNNAGKTAI